MLVPGPRFWQQVASVASMLLTALLRMLCAAGYTEVKPMVFCGLFPTDNDQFETLRDSLGKLQLNDAALVYEPEVSCVPLV